MKKFYSIKALCEGVVRMHSKGKPMNPAGFRPFGLHFTYSEVEGRYIGSVPITGNRIIAPNVNALVAGINKVLDDGGKVEGFRAFRARGSFQLPVKTVGELNVAKKFENTAGSDGASLGSGVVEPDSKGSADSQQAGVVEDPDQGVKGQPLAGQEEVDQEINEPSGEGSCEVSSGDEVESVQEAAATEPDESGQANTDNEEPAIDWTEVEAMTKKQIDKYAESFGIYLDGRKNKSDMISQFKSQVVGGG